MSSCVYGFLSLQWYSSAGNSTPYIQLAPPLVNSVRKEGPQVSSWLLLLLVILIAEGETTTATITTTTTSTAATAAATRKPV